MVKKCELLLPAGGPRQFIAAVENGADAVYIGGPLYNARIGAGNFTLQQMEQAVDYAHLRNVKVYVTMNTLMADEDLDAGVGFAERLYEIGVDALIIQDLGLGRKIKERFPDFELHLSTQATVYNRLGLQAAAKLGYTRAVLARELSLAEISQCSKPEIIETEVFIHGALCICYSGQCQMSRYIGGRSGNKGRCAQPCRLPYMYKDKEGKKINQEYPLSPKDLCMIDRLGDLVEAGVSSLKIEGRMKSPEYVATVARIYRKYLDQYYAHGSYKVSNEDMTDLMQIFNRGGFTEGYADGEPAEELMSGILPKNQGIYVGKITEVRKGGLLADVELSGPLELGDVAEIHSTGIFSMKVTYFEKTGKNTVRIGDLKEKVYAGDRVYRVVSSALMKKAGESFEQIDFDGRKFRRRASVDFTFRADAGKPLMLSAVSVGADGEKIKVETVLEGFTAEPALNRATTEDEISAQLKKTGNTPFEAGRIKIVLGTNIYIPVSKINEIRRNVLEKLETAKIKHYKRVACDAGTEKKRGAAETDKADKKNAELYFYSLKEFIDCDWNILSRNLKKAGINSENTCIMLPLIELAEDRETAEAVKEISAKEGVSIVPYIINLSKGPYDQWLEANMEEAGRLIKTFGGRLYAGNIGWIEPFAKLGLEVCGDYGLNIFNEEAKLAYKELGMSSCTLSLEAEQNTLGDFALMITEHPMKDGRLTDRKGAGYNVRFHEDIHKTIITSRGKDIDWQQAADLWKKTKENIRIYM